MPTCRQLLHGSSHFRVPTYMVASWSIMVEGSVDTCMSVLQDFSTRWMDIYRGVWNPTLYDAWNGLYMYILARPRIVRTTWHASWAWSTVIVDVRACFEQVCIWGRPSSNSLRGRCFWCIQKGSYPKRRMLSGSFFRLCSGVFSIDQICANGSTCVAVVDL